jgi:hypothetical protein
MLLTTMEQTKLLPQRWQSSFWKTRTSCHGVICMIIVVLIWVCLWCTFWVWSCQERSKKQVLEFAIREMHSRQICRCDLCDRGLQRHPTDLFQYMSGRHQNHRNLESL